MSEMLNAEMEREMIESVIDKLNMILKCERVLRKYLADYENDIATLMRKYCDAPFTYDSRNLASYVKILKEQRSALDE